MDFNSSTVLSDNEYEECNSAVLIAMAGAGTGGGSGTGRGSGSGGGSGSGTGGGDNSSGGRNGTDNSANISNQAYLIPRFTGVDEVTVEHFIEALEITSKLCSWNPDQLLQIARLRLGGPAADHIRANNETLTTWDSLKKSLKTRFRPRVPRHVLEKKLTDCAQKKGESVVEFATRLRLIGRQIVLSLQESGGEAGNGAAVYINERILYYFISGVRKDIGRFVWVREPKTLEDAVEYALAEEAQLDNSGRANERDTFIAQLHSTDPQPIAQATTGRVATSSPNLSCPPPYNAPHYSVLENSSAPYNTNSPREGTTPQSRGYNSQPSRDYSSRPSYGNSSYPSRGFHTSTQSNGRGQIMSPRNTPMAQNSQMSRFPVGRYRQPLVCFECGLKDHFAKDCPYRFCVFCQTSAHRTFNCLNKPKNSQRQAREEGR